MLTTEIAINQAKEFVNLCQKNGIEIQKAVLFGSYAQNNFTEFSDIDVALVSWQFSNNCINNNKLTSKINIKFPNIEVHHFNTTYFNTGDSFIFEINKTGIEL